MFNVLELVSKILLIGTAAFTLMLHCRDAAYGWGEKGHRIVANLADTHLTEQARKEVRKLLPEGTTLADAAVWPTGKVDE
jgi:nuclease S1